MVISSMNGILLHISRRTCIAHIFDSLTFRVYLYITPDTKSKDTPDTKFLFIGKYILVMVMKELKSSPELLLSEDIL